jgi:uncharacterized protein (DUF488 family)
MEIYTIGFTQKSAEQFFGLLNEHGIQRLLDIRISNSSQLAGFTKKNDLEFFLRELCGAEYVYQPLLAPPEALMKDFRAKKVDWAGYEDIFNKLMAERHIEEHLSPEFFETRTVLLCSEATPEHCHRQLVAEYLRDRWGDNVEIIHL